LAQFLFPYFLNALDKIFDNHFFLLHRVFEPLPIINDVQRLKILKRVTPIQNPYCRAGMTSGFSKKQPGDSNTNGI
jgi:hypothetical protein